MTYLKAFVATLVPAYLSVQSATADNLQVSQQAKPVSKDRYKLRGVFSASMLSVVPLVAQAQTGVSGGPIVPPTLPPTETQNQLVAPGQVRPTTPMSPGEATRRYWTQERLDAAKPMGLAPSPVSPNQPGPIFQVPPRPPAHLNNIRVPGSPPTVNVPPDFSRRRSISPRLPASVTPIAPGDARPRSPSPPPSPAASGSEGSMFTTARVFPDDAVSQFPYRAVGKLFFNDRGPNGTNPPAGWECSASVTAWRVVLTAGHCVSKGDANALNRYIYSDFVFIPAYDNGAQPYGSWTAESVWVSNAWYSSGAVPNEQDVAMLVVSDQVIGGATHRIGEVTGYLGRWTHSLAGNEVTMLGYPGNLDAGQKMEYSHSQAFADGGSNTAIYGSAMSHGASGGPWIQDFGVAPTWTPGVSDPSVPLGTNMVVGVLSYVPCFAAVWCPSKWAGASIFDDRFIDLYNTACGTNPANCK